MTKKTKKKALIAAAIAAVGIGGAAAVAGAVGGEDGAETPITGAALDRASSAAVAHAGGGRVTETEVGDEEGYYEVEVTRADGSQVDVHLNRDFTVLDATPDSEDDKEGADR
jgi:uncharacterized membrane protein YkoI